MSQAISCGENRLGIEETLEDLLLLNKNLLENSFLETITIFIQSCTNQPKNEKFMNLLWAFCSVKGEAILSNQNKIVEQLVENEDVWNKLFYKIITSENLHRVQIDQDGKLMQFTFD